MLKLNGSHSSKVLVTMPRKLAVAWQPINIEPGSLGTMDTAAIVVIVSY